MTEEAVYIAIRRDLNMRRGKEIAQGIHAFAGLGIEDKYPVITIQVETFEDFLEIVGEARDNEVKRYIACDAGRTEVAPSTVTCIAVGPVEKGKLETLSKAKLY